MEQSKSTKKVKCGSLSLTKHVNTRGEGRNSYRIVAENPEDLVVDVDITIKCLSKM